MYIYIYIYISLYIYIYMYSAEFKDCLVVAYLERSISTFS